MFTKEQIDNLISLGLSGDNASGNHKFADRQIVGSLKRDFLDMIIQVSRWDLEVTDIIFNSYAKDFVRNNLDNDLERNENGPDKIWNVSIHYIDEMPVAKALAVDLINNYPFSSRNVVVFEFDLNHIEKMSELKAFW